MLERCRFVRAGAEDLGALAAGSVDALTTRSVLIYVEDRASAFREFTRVLAPGGRISLFEPVNRYFLDADGRQEPMYDGGPVADLAQRVMAVYARVTPLGGPMMSLDERELVALAEEVGLTDLLVRLEIRVRSPRSRAWNLHARSSPNPLAPTLEEALREALTPAEIERYVEHFRPLVESGTGRERRAAAYLSAVMAAP